MNKYFRIAVLCIFFLQWESNCLAQLTPINFEANGYGASWTWTTFENDSNPATLVVINPVPGGINTSDHVIEFTALQAGQPWAGFESLHGGGIGTFTLDTTNSVIKVMVYKSVISDVGVKLVTPSNASTGELKVANTVINQWEELTFDFTSQIGHPAMTGLDQIVIFPDFDLGGRTSDNICYIDNITMGTPVPPINVTFEVQHTTTSPMYVFGDWNNWSNFPGTPLTVNTNGNYEATLSLPSNRAIEYQFVDGATQEVLNPTGLCTNGNTQFTNRLTNLGGTDTSFCFIWESCSSCIPLSINDILSEQMDLLITTKSLQIRSSDMSYVDEIEIFDFLGRNVFTKKDRTLTNQNFQIELQANQLYVVKIKKGNNTVVLKELIVH